MRTFIADIIPKIQQYSRKLDDLTKLQNQHWVSIGDISAAKTVYIFRDNNQLLISENGRVQKGTWDYLGNQSLLIETSLETLLLKHGFFDENVIALKLDSTNSYAFFVNENKHGTELNTIDDILKFLSDKYLGEIPQNRMQYSKESGSLNDTFTYFIFLENEEYDLIYGKHVLHLIEYSDGLKGKFFKGLETGRYFYHNFDSGKVYCNSKEDVINKYHNYLLRISSNYRN